MSTMMTAGRMFRDSLAHCWRDTAFVGEAFWHRHEHDPDVMRRRAVAARLLRRLRGHKHIASRGVDALVSRDMRMMNLGFRVACSLALTHSRECIAEMVE